MPMKHRVYITRDSKERGGDVSVFLGEQPEQAHGVWRETRGCVALASVVSRAALKRLEVEVGCGACVPYLLDLSPRKQRSGKRCRI